MIFETVGLTLSETCDLVCNFSNLNVSSKLRWCCPETPDQCFFVFPGVDLLENIVLNWINLAFLVAAGYDAVLGLLITFT